MALTKSKLLTVGGIAVAAGLVLVLLGAFLGQIGLGVLNLAGPLLVPAGIACILACFIPAAKAQRFIGIGLLLLAVIAFIGMPVQGGHNNESAGMAGTILFLLLGSAGATLLVLSFILPARQATIDGTKPRELPSVDP
jgi:hypothetical protein